MDREYLVNQLMKIAKQNGVDIDAEVLGMIVNKSIFRVVAKGGILQNVGEETKTAALVLNGICRAYYVDGDGNDITRGFSIPGTLCMDEGLFGYRESIVTWETLEETTLMIFDIQKMKKIIYENNQLKDVYIMLLENALRYKIYRENAFLVENNGRLALFKAFAPLFFWFGFKGTHISAENIKINGAAFCQLDGEYVELQNQSTYIFIKEKAINLISPEKKL